MRDKRAESCTRVRGVSGGAPMMKETEDSPQSRLKRTKKVRGDAVCPEKEMIERRTLGKQKAYKSIRPNEPAEGKMSCRMS